jgi:septum formation protein
VTEAQSIVLASTSPYRRALLDRIGLPHLAVAPRFDETTEEGSDPRETAIRFAESKARSVEEDHAGALIIGSDQTLSIDGELARKPNNPKELLAQLTRLSGRTHELHTGLAILDTARDRIARYIALDEPFGCLGGYTFERRGVCLFANVEGADDSAIVGLPLMSLASCFAKLGIELLDQVVATHQSA